MSLETSELARIEAIESRLKLIESQMPTVASLSEAVIRIADYLAPPASKIVGSRYIADRLGCTTMWVTQMVANGMIPRKLSFLALARDDSGNSIVRTSTSD